MSVATARGRQRASAWDGAAGRWPSSAALSSIAFIAAFKYTYVANVAVIYATVPFMAAAIEWLALGNRTRLQTMATAAVSLVGVAIIVAGSVGGGNLFGDGLAVLMTFGCAVYLVMIRAYRGTPVVWAAAVSSLLLFLAGWIVTDPLAIAGRDFAVIATFGLSFAAASILWTEGARLPAGVGVRTARRSRSAAGDPVRLADPGRAAAGAKHDRRRHRAGRRVRPCRARRAGRRGARHGRGRVPPQAYGQSSGPDRSLGLARRAARLQIRRRSRTAGQSATRFAFADRVRNLAASRMARHLADS